MADRTGRALGTLDPVIYFHNSNMKVLKVDQFTEVHLPHGHFMLPPVGIGEGPGMARRLWEERFKQRGYEWREAGTLSAVDELQEELVEQETRIRQAQGERMDNIRELQRKQTSSNLRQRMISSACTPYERDFIQLWLAMDPEKRKKYNNRFTEYVNYLWAREMDSKTKVEDRMGG